MHSGSVWQHLFPHSFTYRSNSYWETVESLVLSDFNCGQEPFCTVNEHLDPDYIAAFGSSRPLSNQFLLCRAPGWDKNLNRTPVLLVPGAGLDPSSFTNLWDMGYLGLQQQLVALGYRVFAVCFSHYHGDNFFQAEQLAAAITQIKDLCDCDQIDLIAHSKGGVAARIYLSGLGSNPYRGDVNQYIMLGTPNMGTDFAFRNPGASYMIYLAAGNGVIAWDRINYMGIYMDTSARSIYHDGCFPGQNQILFRWDEEYPLDPTQPDWWSSYFGGWGFLSHSRGIDQAIKDGGNLIRKLDRCPLPPELKLSVLAGNNHIFFGTAPGDSSGPGDGIIFLESALYTDGMTSGGAAVKEKTVLPLNHMELLYNYKAAGWIDRQLQP